jgi:predicted hydrocarbon binding protein
MILLNFLSITKKRIKNFNNLSGGERFKLENKKACAIFNRYSCQIGVKEADKPISKTYCSCSLGWMKGLFKTFLDKSVKVELLDSILNGGKTCQFVINLE